MSNLSHVTLPTLPVEGLTREERHAYWQSHLSAWQQSDLSQSAYCRDAGLALHQFMYYRKRLLMVNAQEERLSQISGRDSGAFVPVQVKGTDESVSSTSLNLQVSGGLTITGITAANLSLAVQLVDAL